MSDIKRLAGLDALRGLAALGVLIWHYGGHFGATPWLSALRPFYTAGLYLVDVFLVLSGFLLGQLYKNSGLLPEFFFKRVVRLFPLHWVTLLITLFLQRFYTSLADAPFIYSNNDIFHLILNIALLQQSGLQEGFSFNGPSWSISAEWCVNLIFMVLLLAPTRRFHLAFGMTIAALLCLAIGQGRLIGTGTFGWLDFGLLRGVFGFFLGVLLADLLNSRKFDRFSERFGTLTYKIWDGAGVLSGCILLFFMSRQEWQRIPSVDFIVIGLCVPLLVASFSHGAFLKKICQRRFFIWLGDVSFSVYLWHFPLQIIFALLQKQGIHIDFSAPSTLLAFIGLSYTLGYGSWVLLEKPAQRLAYRSRLAQRVFRR